ncbi:ABC transporter permease [Ruminiclostridium josui]|uniref:ABC transporter permease n=1 Tax=Ruminiclostridium josui TaxID=1499 RepID=UPI0006D15699|nr:ABC transporter permease [Ruminiclostridium josui]
MKKNIYLLFCKTISLIKNNRLISAVLLLVQIITILSVTFFFTTIVKSRASYVATYTAMRTIAVNMSNGKYNAKNHDIAAKIANNGIDEIENIEFHFFDKSSSEKQPRELIAYLHPELCSNDVFGTPISQEDIKKCKKVVIPSNQNKELNPSAEEYKIDDTLRIAGNSFRASGIRHGGYLDEIPYTTGLNLLYLSSFRVIIHPDVSQNQKEDLQQYFENTFQGTVRLPKPVSQKTISSLFFPLIASVFIGIIAILNFIFIYKYMMKKCRRDYIILRICGCSRFMTIFLVFAQLVLIFSFSYIISMCLFFLLRQLSLGRVISDITVTFQDCIIIYTCFVLIIITIIAPFALSFFRNSLISSQKFNT